jgi:hypothetical protein
MSYYETSILNIKAFAGLLLLLLAMAALLLIAAWTLDYWQAWTFLAAYFGCSLAITLYLMVRDPKLLQRRMSVGPMAKEPTQKIIMFLTSLGFIGLLIVPALDHRFAWSRVPSYMALAGEAGRTARLVSLLSTAPVHHSLGRCVVHPAGI